MKTVNSRGCYFFAALFLGLVGSVAQAGPIRGLVDCLNDEDCVGADRICFRNITMEVGKCVCQEGYKPAKEDPIKCLNIGKTFFLPLLFFSLDIRLDNLFFFSEENEC